MEKQEVIDHLKKLASQHKDKEYLTLKELRVVPKLAHYVYFYFDSIAQALREAGLKTSRLASSMDISDDDIISYLRALKIEVGHPAELKDIKRDQKIYKIFFQEPIGWKIISTRFGGLRKANALAEGTVNAVKEPPAKRNVSNQPEDVEVIENKGKFWGKAAELHVTAELLYRGFQAATIPIDVGLDVLAVKNNKTYYFQVKHKDLGRNDAIELTKSSFRRTGGGDVYFIFVLLSEGTNTMNPKRDFVIVPFHNVNEWIIEGLAEDTDKHYQLYITIADGKYMLGEKNLTHFLNNWNIIR